jgi:uncharacterized protein (TIGR03437 family)
VLRYPPAAILLTALALGAPPSVRRLVPSDSPVVTIQSIALDSAGNSYVTGALQGGPFEARFLRTTDLGATWTRIAAPDEVTSLVPDPVDPQVLFGLANAAIHKTSDGGRIWRVVYRGTVSSLAIDPANRDRIAAITPDGLIRSLNRGETWTPGAMLYYGGPLVTDPSGSGALLVVGPSAISRDWGATIEYLKLPAPWSISAAAFDPVRRGWIYVGTSAGSTGAFYVSTDFGATWTARTAPSRFFLRTLALDPDVPDLIVASGIEGIFRSVDAGVSWKRVEGITSLDGASALVSRRCASTGGLFAKISGLGSYGASFSLDFGVTWQAPQLTNIASVSAGGGCSFYVVRTESTDAVVTKLAPDGAVVWTTNLGGLDGDTPIRLAVDSVGSAYVVGNTTSPDFPMTLPRLGPRGPNTVFLTKLTPQGAVDYSVLIGGESNTTVTGVAVDRARNAYVAGNTLAGRFPVTGGAMVAEKEATSYSGFVAKFAPGGTLLAATYLGPSYSTPLAIAIDSTDQPTLLGRGDLPGYPAPDPQTAFLARLDPTLSRIDRAMHLPTRFHETAALAIDAEGSPIVAANGYGLEALGAYESPRSPAPCRSKSASVSDLAIEKLRSADWKTVYRAVLHTPCGVQVRDAAVDRAGAPVVTLSAAVGLPLSRPTIGAPLCQQFSGAVARLSRDGAQLDYASYLDNCPGAPPGATIPAPAAGLSLDRIANTFSGDPTGVVEGGLFTLAVAGVALPAIDLGLNGAEPLPTTLSGVEVRFDGVPAGIVQTAAGRVVVVVPHRMSKRGATRRETAVQLYVNGAASNVVRMPVADSLPGLLTADFLYPAAHEFLAVAYALNADGTVNSRDNPAAPGSTLTFFATGMGSPPVPVYSSWRPLFPASGPETVEPLSGFLPAIWRVKMTVPSAPPGSEVRQVSVGLRFGLTPSSIPYASNGVSIFVK